MTERPNTQYITARAPNLSDIQPPAARITPEGKLKTAVNVPASTTVVE